MKHFSDKEIEVKIRSIWEGIRPREWGNTPDKIDVRQEKDIVKITMSSMYDAPGLSLAHLRALAEYFGTENINDDDRFSNGGCEYGFTLTIRPNKDVA